MGCYKTSALNRTIQNNYLDGFSCVNNVISYSKPEQDWDICRFNSVFKSDRTPEVLLIYLESLRVNPISLSYPFPLVLRVHVRVRAIPILILIEG